MKQYGPVRWELHQGNKKNLHVAIFTPDYCYFVTCVRTRFLLEKHSVQIS